MHAPAQQHVHDASVLQPREDDNAQARITLLDHLQTSALSRRSPLQHRVLAYEYVIGRSFERLLHANLMLRGAQLTLMLGID